MELAAALSLLQQGRLNHTAETAAPRHTRDIAPAAALTGCLLLKGRTRLSST